MRSLARGNGGGAGDPVALISPHCWLCRCLAPNTLCPTAALQDSLDAPNFAWEPMLALAHRHLVAGSWYAALQRRGLLERVPVEMAEHLAALHTLSIERNQLLRRELVRAACAFNTLGVEPLLLKGGLALLPGQSPEITARLLGDLDLLIPADRIADCRNALRAFGYYATHEEDRYASHHHAPPLFHPDHGAKFELHRAVLGRSLAAALPAEEVWRDSQRIGIEKAIMRTPSLTHRVLHNLLHTLLQDRRAELGTLELRQVLDLVQFRASDDDKIDWPLIQARFAVLGQGAALGAYLRMIHNLFDQPPPDGMRFSKATAWLEWKFELCRRHPRASRGFYWLMRLKRLPKRLLTPSWYPAKIRELRQGKPL